MTTFGIAPLPAPVDDWDAVAELYEIELPFQRGDRVITPDGEMAYFYNEMKGVAEVHIIDDAHHCDRAFYPVKSLKKKEY